MECEGVPSASAVAAQFGVPEESVRVVSRGTGAAEVLLRLKGGSDRKEGGVSVPGGFPGVAGAVPGAVPTGGPVPGAGPGAAAGAPGGIPAPAGPGSRSASLWVGDLNSDVDETTLYEYFNSVAHVASIRLCRHSISRKSLGYAYVNFESVKEAERVLDTMNYTLINGRPCRIMWSERDPARRRSGVGNIFVKGLSKEITTKELHDMFSTVGNIVSCHVVWDEKTNQSRGYGYVQFETEEDAKTAIEEYDGAEVEDSEVRVESFKPKPARKARWNNLYVKNFPRTWGEKELSGYFSEFGEILSVMVAHRDDGSGKGFGYVCFRDPESAQKAVDARNGKVAPGMDEQFRADQARREAGEADEEDDNADETDVGMVKKGGKEGKKEEEEEDEGAVSSKAVARKAKPTGPPPMYVGPHQKRDERLKELREKAENRRAERQLKLQGLNLYVRNLDESVTEDELRRAFSPFGTITSVRISTDEAGRSKLFGYVCFSAPEEAARAQQAMNQHLLNGKPLYVALWQPRQARQAHLEQQSRAREMRRAMGAAGAGYGAAYAAGMDPTAMAAAQAAMMAAQQQQQQQRGGGAGGPAPGFNPAALMGAMNPAALQSMIAAGMVPAPGAVPGGRPDAATMAAMMAAQQQQQQQQQQRAAAAAHARASSTPSSAPVSAPPTSAASSAGGAPPAAAGSAPISASQLAAMPEETRRQFIGERLYHQIRQIDPARAPKITGMLLEGFSDVTELLHLLESPEALRDHVQDASRVLSQHGTAE